VVVVYVVTVAEAVAVRKAVETERHGVLLVAQHWVLWVLVARDRGREAMKVGTGAAGCKAAAEVEKPICVVAEEKAGVLVMLMVAGHMSHHHRHNKMIAGPQRPTCIGSTSSC